VNRRRRKLIERLGIAGVLLAMAALSLALRPSAYAQTPPVAAAAAPAQPMITAAVNDAIRATLAGNTRPEATAANDRGRVDDAMPLQHMQLQLRRPAAREEAVKALIEQLHDPKSPNFHHWLTATDFGAQFGPAASDIASVTGCSSSRASPSTSFIRADCRSTIPVPRAKCAPPSIPSCIIFR
jgi:hypothetical protein